MPNIDDPVWQLSEYLRSGYLRDLDIRSTAGIETDFFTATTEDKTRPPWWPIGFDEPQGEMCLFVGRKDFKEELGSRDWFKELPQRARKQFLPDLTPWSQ